MFIWYTIDILNKLGDYLNRQNKKENVAALHKSTIMDAAEQVFLEKSFYSATIEDISQTSKYSRRTIYAYFDSKEDILYHLILKGLLLLKEDLDLCLKEKSDFIERYWCICKAMEMYAENSPQSADSVNQAKHSSFSSDNIPPVVLQILQAGTEINLLLENAIEDGKKQGVVLANIAAKQTVYVLWSSIHGLLSLVRSKGGLLEKEFSATKKDFLEYGFKQIINSILIERI